MYGLKAAVTVQGIYIFAPSFSQLISSSSDFSSSVTPGRAWPWSRTVFQTVREVYDFIFKPGFLGIVSESE